MGDDVLTVAIDTSFEDVLKLDEAGERLTWDEKKFPVYNQEQVRQLSDHNRISYHQSFFLAESAKRPAEDRPTPGLQISGRLASPSSKLKVSYPVGYRDKWHTYWERADAFYDSLARGYVAVNTNEPEDKGLQAFYNSPDGSIRVGVTGRDEMILMKEPKEQNDERVRQGSEQSRLNNGQVDESAAEEIRKVGGLPYNPEKDSRKDKSYNWRGIKAV